MQESCLAAIYLGVLCSSQSLSKSGHCFSHLTSHHCSTTTWSSLRAARRRILFVVPVRGHPSPTKTSIMCYNNLGVFLEFCDLKPQMFWYYHTRHYHCLWRMKDVPFKCTGIIRKHLEVTLFGVQAKFITCPELVASRRAACHSLVWPFLGHLKASVLSGTGDSASAC